MVLLTVLMLALQCTVLSAQRTYQRSCECEYTVDGKCAYTLLLPAGSGETGATCPSNSEKTDLLQSELANLQEQVTQLSESTAEQTQVIAQLQSDLLAEVINKLALITSCDCSAIDSTFVQHSEQLQMLQAELEQNYITYKKLNNTLNELMVSASITETEQMELKAVQDQLSSNVQTLDESIRGQAKEIQDTFYLCRQKGLIVSGQEAFVPDEQITASSTYDDSHSAVRSRIYMEKDGAFSGAWCPSKCSTLCYVILDRTEAY